jgi:hypothetical protein
VEGFREGRCRRAAARRAHHCISPTVLAEVVAYHDYFTGFTPVPAAEVAFACLRAISHPITGRILKLHKTAS